MDRFDLEEQIMKLHSIVDSLNDICYGVLECDMDKHEIANALDGLAVLTEVRLNKLFDVFKQAFRLDQYSCQDDFK